MTDVFALYAWLDIDEGGKEHVATFIETPFQPDPRARAHEVMRRLTADDRYESMSIESLKVNPTNKELELKPTLAEMQQRDIVDAAARELLENAEVMIPLWINPAWLVHEVRANYDVGIDFVGRTMTLVSKEEVQRRVREGHVPERRQSPRVVTEEEAYDRSVRAEDAGFTETP